MQPHCSYRKLPDGRWRCEFCNDTTARAYENYSTRRVCHRGLGGLVKRCLSAVGITPERYLAARGGYRVIGGQNPILVKIPDDEPRGCGCESREEWLARAGAYLVNRLFT